MSPDTLEKLLLLVIGFLLTSVAGTLIATVVQRRFWKHQWQLQSQKEWVDSARAIFEEVSRLMDRRLFRLNQLFIWSRRDDKERMANSLKHYRVILAEWNESINRNLSMLQFFFGTEIREQLDFEIGANFIHAGDLVETYYRDPVLRTEEKATDIKKIIRSTRSSVYNFNLKMLAQIARQSAHRNFVRPDADRTSDHS